MSAYSCYAGRSYKMSPVGLEPWLFTSLETTLPVVPAGNLMNCLHSPVINNGRLLNALWDYVCLRNRARNAYLRSGSQVFGLRTHLFRHLGVQWFSCSNYPLKSLKFIPIWSHSLWFLTHIYFSPEVTIHFLGTRNALGLMTQCSAVWLLSVGRSV